MPKAKTASKSKTTKKPIKKSFLSRFVAFAKTPIGLLVVFVALFSAVGGYAVIQSKAATPYLSSYGCYQRGRVWVGGTGNPCANKCIPAGYTSVYDYNTKQTYTYWAASAGSLVYATPYNYCSAAVTKASAISYDKCWNALSRDWVSGTGCARDWRRIGGTSSTGYGVPSKQCRYTTYYYHSAPSGSYDYCSATSRN